MSINVRPLREDDAAQVIHLLSRYKDETLPKEQHFSPSRAAMLVTLCQTRPDEYCCFVAEAEGGRRIGFIFGCVRQNLLTPGCYVEDKGIYVMPEYRNTPTAYHLGVAFLQWAEKTGAEYTRGEAALDAPIMKAAAMAGYRTVGYINKREIKAK